MTDRPALAEAIWKALDAQHTASDLEVIVRVLAEHETALEQEREGERDAYRIQGEELLRHIRLAEAAETRCAQVEQELADQRAELTGHLSDRFREIPACYDTSADHYREMARRIVESRDALKHENRHLAKTLTTLQAEHERLRAALEAKADRMLEGCAEARKRLEDTRLIPKAIKNSLWFLVEAVEENAQEIAALAPSQEPIK